jgi:uncharacterized Fe-S cluster-containing radical SAM superfamily protein
MRILLLQLPIQTHDFFFSNENIPLASACLQMIAVERGMDATLLPGHRMRYGSDQAILRSIVDANPDIVGMSCYLWNLERTLFVAKQVKLHLPACTVVLGGPEITPDNEFLLAHGNFDIGVVGEGEGVWGRFLDSYPEAAALSGLLVPRKGGGYSFTGFGIGKMPLSRLPSPYLGGFLDRQLQGTLWLETVRGCAYRCAYCYYHKQSPRLRTFPIERVLSEIKRAKEQGLKEIVFLDPCFIRRPGLEKLLDRIVEVNHDRQLQLHGESTVEGIDSGLARKMSKAGFVEIEVGIQSVNQKTLRRIHRTFQPQKLLDGVHCLQDQGIETMVDIIAGLPGDTLSDICKSIDWVIEEEAYDYLMLYPLSLIPSTELREMGGSLGLAAMPEPPYLLTRGPQLTAQEICQAFHHYEGSMGEDIAHLEMPPILGGRSGASSVADPLCNHVTWSDPADVGRLGMIGDRTSYALTVSMTKEVLHSTSLWSTVLKDYLRQNPFSLLSVEVPADAYPEELHPLWSLAKEHRHFGDRDYTVTHTPYRSFFLFSRAGRIAWKWPDPRESFPYPLHDGQKVDCKPVCLVVSEEEAAPKWFVDHMAKRYPSLPEIRIWQVPEN